MSGAFEIVMEHRRALVEKIIEMMKQGRFMNGDEWNRAALSPHNPLSNVTYKGGNRLRLMQTVIEKGYTDPRWATLKQYRDKGYFPKKGEHGILCEKWIFTKEKTIRDENGNKKKVTEELENPQVSYFKVFNAQQIQGIPKYQVPEFQETDLTHLMNDFMGASECPIKELAQERAFYSPATDEIVLPLREHFKDEVSFAKTVIHEMGHSTGHKTRLNRDFSGSFGTPNYAKEELIAEIGAMFVEVDLKINLQQGHFEDHSDYLSSWIQVLKNDYNELFRASASAEKISERLIGNYSKKYNLSMEPVYEVIPDNKINIPENEIVSKRSFSR